MTNSFTTVHPAAASVLAARVGKVVLPGRKSIQTPHYVAITSRGVVPHLSPDVARNHTTLGCLYIGLEDFLEKAPKEVPPILNLPQNHPHESRLRNFIAAQDDDILILGARRAKPVVAPQYNLPNALAILTSVGFHHLTDKAWLQYVEALRPDIIIGFADMSYGHAPGIKRREKMVDRTHAYTRDATNRLYKKSEDSNQGPQPLYFAPILPIDNTEQSLYLQDLEDELRPGISGLAVYESASLSAISKGLEDLPRLCFNEPRAPQDIIRDISLGADLLIIPFIGDLADAGIALDFVFSRKYDDQHDGEANKKPKPLGLNLWDNSFATEVAPICEGCQCYACQKHHRAYIHHLLSAKEMLAWSLVQIHNHHVMDLFFKDIRQSIIDGTFETNAALFERKYESAFPTQTGVGPRLRGYSSHVSRRDEPRRNPRSYGILNDALEKYAEAQSSAIATPDVDAEELQKQGFAEKSADF
ncbi:hypothetical protein UA08_00419 [Talaromyces atroroseus]|uniref:Queuine tRNA-ribosyltransferase accessory subunit 2 n=1 Tax=Talaromyces atroroseus TaxID=1441469 RepID=A0A225AS38_TALAT|nr:hypothetical protein UA08_00419 [Talaromyces atroroseus]OKL63810.1 hypothetical protein UA08_00419 [Talaromyces atroroseus]